jgi:hypothetical protein
MTPCSCAAGVGTGACGSLQSLPFGCVTLARTGTDARRVSVFATFGPTDGVTTAPGGAGDHLLRGSSFGST